MEAVVLKTGVWRPAYRSRICRVSCTLANPMSCDEHTEEPYALFFKYPIYEPRLIESWLFMSAVSKPIAISPIAPIFSVMGSPPDVPVSIANRYSL